MPLSVLICVHLWLNLFCGAALAQKLSDGQLVVVETLAASEIKTKAAAAMLKKLGVDGKAVLIDVKPDQNLARSIRNLPGIHLVTSARVTARDIMNAGRVVTTKSALERLQEALAVHGASPSEHRER